MINIISAIIWIITFIVSFFTTIEYERLIILYRMAVFILALNLLKIGVGEMADR